MMQFRVAAVAAAALLAVGAAQARSPSTVSASAVSAGVATTITVDLTGWETYGGFGSSLNTSLFLDLAPGTEILGFDYTDLTFTTFNFSWASELVLSVNDSEAFDFLDWRPSTVQAGGSFGPLSGSWGSAPGTAGPFGAGAPFVVPEDGVLWINVYETYNDAGDSIDARITGGTLSIYTLAPVPEPATYGLMALGLAAVGAAARRRRAG